MSVTKNGDDRAGRNSLTAENSFTERRMRYSNWVNGVFYQTHPCVHRTVINRFKNYCFSIQMGVASGFQGLDSVGRDVGNGGDERTKGAKMEEEEGEGGGGMQKRGEREWQPC